MNIQQFLNTSYTAYHTTENVCKILLSQGFEQLEVGKNWDLQQGKGYFVTRNGSSVIAFKVGTNRIFNIVESHTDSPCFKIKGDKLLATEGAKKLNTEKYGGSLMYTFLDRPLKIAGRLLVNNDGVVNVMDASAILSAYTALSTGGTITSTQAKLWVTADVDHDGRINASDASCVLSYASKAGTGYTGTFEQFMATR